MGFPFRGGGASQWEETGILLEIGIAGSVAILTTGAYGRLPTMRIRAGPTFSCRDSLPYEDGQCCCILARTKSARSSTGLQGRWVSA